MITLRMMERRKECYITKKDEEVKEERRFTCHLTRVILSSMGVFLKHKKDQSNS